MDVVPCADRYGERCRLSVCLTVLAWLRVPAQAPAACVINRLACRFFRGGLGEEDELMSLCVCVCVFYADFRQIGGEGKGIDGMREAPCVDAAFVN